MTVVRETISYDNIISVSDKSVHVRIPGYKFVIFMQLYPPNTVVLRRSSFLLLLSAAKYVLLSAENSPDCLTVKLKHLCE